MDTKRSILILCLIIIFILIINLCPAESQWLGPSLTFNITLSPYLQSGLHLYDSSFLGRRLNPFQTTTSPFDSGFTLGSSTLGLYDDTLNMFYIISSYLDPYPLKKTFSNNTQTETQTYNTLAQAGHCVAVTDGYLAICKGELIKTAARSNPFTIYDLQIIDIKDPRNHKKVSELRFESESEPNDSQRVKKLLINEGFVYVLTNNPAGLYIIDLGDIEAPELIRYLDLDFLIAEDIEIRKGWAFISLNDYDSLITSWNISDPANPLLADSVVLDGWLEDIFIDMEVVLAIGDNICGLNVIDISEPEAMDIIDHYDLSGQTVWMTRGGILTAGGDDNTRPRFRVLDYDVLEGFTPVPAPILLGKEQIVCAKEDTVYVLTYSPLNNFSQIYIFLMNESTSRPELLDVDVIKVNGECTDLKIYGRYLVAQMNNHILLWDITDTGTTPEGTDAIKIDMTENFDYLEKSNETEETNEGQNSLNNTERTWPYDSSFSGPLTPYSPISSWTFPCTKWSCVYPDFSTPQYIGARSVSSSPLLDLIGGPIDLGVNGIDISF